MYTIILLSILFVVGIVVAWLLDKYTCADGWAAFCTFISGVSLAVLLICLACLINIDKRFDYACYRYETTVQMVESYKGYEFGNMQSLVEEVVSMNKVIANHKAHYNSKWTGLWHSERIANLEPIRFNKERPELE